MLMPWFQDVYYWCICNYVYFHFVDVERQKSVEKVSREKLNNNCVNAFRLQASVNIHLLMDRIQRSIMLLLEIPIGIKFDILILFWFWYFGRYILNSIPSHYNYYHRLTFPANLCSLKILSLLDIQCITKNV